MKSLLLLSPLCVLTGCGMLMEAVGPEGSVWSMLWGVAKAVPEATQAGLSGLETGGWVAGGIAAALALAKGGLVAWHKLGSVAEDTVAKGVKKVNGSA